VEEKTNKNKQKQSKTIFSSKLELLNNFQPQPTNQPINHLPVILITKDGYQHTPTDSGGGRGNGKSEFFFLSFFFSLPPSMLWGYRQRDNV